MRSLIEVRNELWLIMCSPTAMAIALIVTGVKSKHQAKFFQVVSLKHRMNLSLVWFAQIKLLHDINNYSGLTYEVAHS